MNQPLEIMTLALVVLVVAILSAWLARHYPRKLNKPYFQARWQDIQKLCGSEDTWPLAVINADKLVDEALRKANYKGNAMGQRLISAQAVLTNNDKVWVAHKLRNKLVHEDSVRLKKDGVMAALVSFRSALKDLGAL
jgi:hypothetical protein